MAASDLTSVAFIYKRLYSDRQVGDLAMRDHPLFRMINKEGGFVGASFHYPIRYGNPQGISGAFANAQTNASSSKGVQLTASRRPKFAVITMDGEAIAAAEGNRGAFLDLVTQETEGKLEELGDHLAFDLYRDGTCARGRRSSLAGDIVTLTVPDDARNFKVGMTVIADDTATGASPRTGSTTIAAIDEDAGTITLTSAAAIVAFADNDYLFTDGEQSTGMEGLASQIPLTAPTAGDSFRGIDRSVDTRRLAGVRVNDTATAIEENAGLCAVKISQVGKKASQVYLNPINFWQVARRLNAKVEYQGAGGTADYGFEYIAIHTPAGTLRTYSDPDCPTSRGYVCNPEATYIKHLRGLPHIVQDDGRPNLRQASANGIEARAAAWSNLILTMPGSCGVFAI